MTTLPANTTATSFAIPIASPLAELSIEQYDLMIDAGVFEREGPRQRIELIEGVLLQMSPIGHEHENAVDWLARWSFDNTKADEVRVRIQESLALPGQRTVPEPDIAWVRSGAYDKGRPAASDVLLVVEVATGPSQHQVEGIQRPKESEQPNSFEACCKTSVAHDLGKKAELYAAAEIADYWVADLKTRSLVVHRNPADGRYASITTLRGAEILSPLAKPDASLTVASLFASGKVP